MRGLRINLFLHTLLLFFKFASLFFQSTHIIGSKIIRRSLLSKEPLFGVSIIHNMLWTRKFDLLILISYPVMHLL